jgi:hypothetical protein
MQIDYENIVQLHPARKRTWAVYAQESEENKFFFDEVECWAVVEHVRQCEQWEAPALYVGAVPCIRETVVRPLFMDEMTTSAYSEGGNLLGYTHNPRSNWREEAEVYFARHAEEQEATSKRREERKKPFAVYAPAPWDITKDRSDPPYFVVDHGPGDISKYCKGDYWDSTNDPPPTRSERERHANFLGWAIAPEAQWTEEERRMWHEKASAYLQRKMKKKAV